MNASLSLRAARRLALRAQGFAQGPSATVGQRRLLTLIERLGALQIDSVSALVRAHYLPAFSRLGPYDRALLERAAWGPGRQGNRAGSLSGPTEGTNGGSGGTYIGCGRS